MTGLNFSLIVKPPPPTHNPPSPLTTPQTQTCTSLLLFLPLNVRNGDMVNVVLFIHSFSLHQRFLTSLWERNIFSYGKAFHLFLLCVSVLLISHCHLVYPCFRIRLKIQNFLAAYLFLSLPPVCLAVRLSTGIWGWFTLESRVWSGPHHRHLPLLLTLSFPLTLSVSLCRSHKLSNLTIFLLTNADCHAPVCQRLVLALNFCAF